MVATRPNILVVDDRAENRLALKAILSGSQYNIVEADSGPAALRELVEREFAVLLVDVVMPGMDGFELANIVRSRPKTASVPIVFVTAVATDIALVFKGYRAGAVDYLIKPLDAEIVRSKIAVLTELFRLRKMVESSLREKEVLIREVHHRVKNNLQMITSLLHMQSSRQAPPVNELLAESEARVRAMSLVFDAVYNVGSLESVDVDRYLGLLLGDLRQTHAASHVNMGVVSDGIHLPIDTATCIGLVVHELVDNALRHAFPGDRGGSVSVRLERQDTDQLLLEVSDTGIGLPDSIDITRPQSLGFQVVSSLTSQLDDSLEVIRSGGTTIRIRFRRPRL